MVTENKPTIQFVWGVLLILAGAGVVVRASLLDAELRTLAGHPATAVFIRICIYIMTILLIGGGVRKLRGYFKK